MQLILWPLPNFRVGLYIPTPPCEACLSCQPLHPPYHPDLQIFFHSGLRVRVGGRLCTRSAPPLARLAFTTLTGRDAFFHTLLGTQLEPECWGCRWGPVYSFNKYLLSTSRVPGPVLGPGGSAESKISRGASPGGRADGEPDKQGSVQYLRQ